MTEGCIGKPEDGHHWGRAALLWAESGTAFLEVHGVGGRKGPIDQESYEIFSQVLANCDQFVNPKN